MVATLLDVFPHVSLFLPTQGAVLFAASETPFEPVATARRALADAPADYARSGVELPEDVAAAWALSDDHVRDLADGAPILTDDENALATRSARIGRRALSHAGGDELLSRYEPLSLAGDGLDPVHVISRLASIGLRARAQRLVQSLEDPTLRNVALGWAKIDRAPQAATAHFRRALAADPELGSARFGLLRVLRRRVESGDAAALELAAPLEGSAAAVVAGWRHAALGEWEAVRALEPALAEAGPRDLARNEARRLRVRWRIASADPAARAESAALARELLSGSVGPEDALLAAQAFAAADRPDDALALVDHVSRRRRRTDTQRAALALLEEVRPEVDAGQWQEVKRRLERVARR
jgi:hypothetical protein